MERRKVIDCRKFPSDMNCTVAISGREEEVLPLVVYYAVTVHGDEDTPELWVQLKALLEDE